MTKEQAPGGFPEAAWFPGPGLLAEPPRMHRCSLREPGSSDAVASITANSRTQPPLDLLSKEGSDSRDKDTGYAEGSW